VQQRGDDAEDEAAAAAQSVEEASKTHNPPERLEPATVDEVFERLPEETRMSIAHRTLIPIAHTHSRTIAHAC
jgi:hypothetical protein